MANLSDLLSPDRAVEGSSGWIGALRPAGGFRELAMEAPRAVPEPDASVDLPDERESALAEAYARGMADALLQAEAERDAAEAARSKLALAFARLDAEAALALRHRLAEAVATLCEQVIEPARIDRAALAERCAALANQIGEGVAACALHLHPLDIALLDDETRQQWEIRPDPALPRGTLRLEGADGVLADGPEEWRRLIAGALTG